MNMSILHLMMAGATICLFSCASGDQREDEQSQKILSSPPFESVSDSIKKFPDNVELRLRRATLLSQKSMHEVATNDYKKSWEITGDENIGLMYVSNLLLSDQVNEAIKFLGE